MCVCRSDVTEILKFTFTDCSVGGEGCQQNSWLTVSGSIGKKGAGSIFHARNVIHNFLGDLETSCQRSHLPTRLTGTQTVADA